MDWPKIEQNVNEAEKVKRKAQKASQVLHSEVEIEIENENDTKKEKVPKVKRDVMAETDILRKSKRERVAGKALEREKAFEQEAENMLGEENSPERQLVKFRKCELAKALRYADALEKQRKKLLNEEAEILKGIADSPGGEEQEALQEIKTELEDNSRTKEDLMKISPEAYFGLHLGELKEYSEELKIGGIAETPYVKEQAEDILRHLRAGIPVLIYGHLGSGKTELAMHVAKKYIGKEALIISGSKHTTLAEFYGHQVLTADEKTGSTISDFFLGPIYRAMEEGRPVIIDEVNAIPHEVLISLNHILTRKVGDKVNVQQNSGSSVEVKEGFGIIMTGNLNQGQETYIDREDMDPAFLSRLHKIEYDYLPQSTDGTLEEAGEEDQQFHLLLAEIMDRNGNIEVPEGAVKKLWNLAKAARITQNVFAGKEISSAFYFQEGGGRSIKYLLKENLLSMRSLENVVKQWKAEGCAQEVDYYLWNNFIREGTVAADRAYLYQLLKDRFGFFQSNGWEQSPNYGAGGVINSFDLKPPKNKSEKKEFFGSRQVVEFAFGKSPERAKWPEVSGIEKDENETENDLEKIMELEKLQREVEKRIKDLEKLQAESADDNSKNKSSAGADEEKAKIKTKKDKKKKFGIF